MPTRLPVASFWTWWSAEGATLVSHSIASGDFTPAQRALTERVARMHPDLEWELGPGAGAAHRLTVTSGGLAAVRPFAERWFRAAPVTSATWEYSPSRARRSDALQASIQLGPVPVRLSDAQWALELDERRALVDIAFWHPALAESPESIRSQACFLMLDWLLGEDDVERWAGSVSFDRPLERWHSSTDLIGLVDWLPTRFPRDAWTTGEGQVGEHPALLSTRTALRWIDDPTLDLHTLANLPFATSRGDGLPDEAAQTWIQQAEEWLLSAVGHGTALVATVTARGTRQLHLYSDSQDQNAVERLRAALAQLGAQVQHQPDPAWQAVATLR